MFFDLALCHDPQIRRCDLVIGDDGDLVIDETPVTPVLLSIGLDRRAAPDDELPEGRTRFLAPASYSERRGAVGDALDPDGDLTGSRCWLLNRAKETETTRALYYFWLKESLACAEPETGEPADIDVWWSAPQRLSYRLLVHDTEISLSRPVS